MMNKFLRYCCGEGEEEHKFGTFVVSLLSFVDVVVAVVVARSTIHIFKTHPWSLLWQDAELAKELGWDIPFTSAVAAGDVSTTGTNQSQLLSSKKNEAQNNAKNNDDVEDDPRKIRQLEKQIYRINRYRNLNDNNTKESKANFKTNMKSKSRRGTVFGRPYSINDKTYRAPNFPKTPDEQEFLRQALQNDFLFQNLDQTEQTKFIKAMQNEKIPAGTQLYRQDDLSDCFCVVETGTIEFIHNDKVVRTCGTGESFGDLELILDAKQSVSSVARTDVSLYKVHQQTFQEMLANHDRNNQKQAKDWLSRISLFQNNMSHGTIGRMTKSVVPVKWTAGSLIFCKGEEALVFYIIQSGSVRLHDIGFGDSQTEEIVLNAGDFLGERSLLFDQARSANATASTDVTALAMDRSAIEASVGGKLKNILLFEIRKRALMCLPMFSNSNLSEPEYDMLVGCLREECYPKGYQLAKVGEPINPNLLLIRHGRLIVYSGKMDQMYNLESGDYFGDQNIKTELVVSGETVTCEEKVTVDVLTRDDIEEVIGDMERLGDAANLSRIKEKPAILLHNLRRHRVLGRGGFGKVYLVSHPQEDNPEERDVYALKVISKARIIDSKLTKAVIREKELLCLLDHPLILNLVHSYQDEDFLYLLLPFIPGGELYELHEREKTNDRGMKNSSVAFYAACIIEALSHFHRRRIAYRDVKMENVAIDGTGYGVLVDLGFAKVVTDKTYTLVGTPEMLAPEIIMSKGHDEAVDYWAFGVVCYELLVGQSPFYEKGANQMDVFKRIILVDYDMPDFLEDSAKDLIRRLLVRPPSKRLGKLSNGYLDIKRHSWFQENGIGFKNIRRKATKAPWVPDMRDPLGFSFLQHAVNSMDFDEPPSRRLTRSDQEIFRGF